MCFIYAERTHGEKENKNDSPRNLTIYASSDFELLLGVYRS
jgi:hypothetical protein